MQFETWLLPVSTHPYTQRIADALTKENDVTLLSQGQGPYRDILDGKYIREAPTALQQPLHQRCSVSTAQFIWARAHMCVGIGVSIGEQAKQVGANADDINVGSALVEAFADNETYFDAGLVGIRMVAKVITSGVKETRL